MSNAPIPEPKANDVWRQMAASKDAIIASAITATIGDGWELPSIIQRLTRTIYPNDIEVIALDGKEILELHPIRIEQSTEGGGIKVTVAQNYRRIQPSAQCKNCENEALPVIDAAQSAI